MVSYIQCEGGGNGSSGLNLVQWMVSYIQCGGGGHGSSGLNLVQWMVSYIQCGGGGNGSSGLVGDLGFYWVVLANVLDSGQYRLPRLLDLVNFDLTVL